MDNNLINRASLKVRGSDIHMFKNLVQKYYFVCQFPELGIEAYGVEGPVLQEAMERCFRMYLMGKPLVEAYRQVICNLCPRAGTAACCKCTRCSNSECAVAAVY